MPAKFVPTQEEREHFIQLFHSDLGMKAVAKVTGRDVHRSIRPIWVEEFGEEGIKERCSRLNRLHKVGKLNPMWGRSGLKHPNSKASGKRDVNGYVVTFIPDWYTGKRYHNRILEHVVVYCESNGITELPPKHVVHHIDQDKTNNSPENLIMLSISDHMKLHAKLRKGATTREESRTPQESGEAHSTLQG